MRDFITGLQFLTRIHIVKQDHWQNDSFGRSVKFFPLIGGIIGMLLVAVHYLLDSYLPLLGIYIPSHVLTTVLTALPILITGGLHCDGFMDTMDGVFSGRSRERALEIMKDSRIGAHGVTAFVLLILAKWSLLADIPANIMPLALFSAPVLGRMAMVLSITAFPYARPEGMGKSFTQFANKRSLWIAVFFTGLLIIPLGKQAILGSLISICFALLFSYQMTHLLGGNTGDTYGAVSELTEIIMLSIFLF